MEGANCRVFHTVDGAESSLQKEEEEKRKQTCRTCKTDIFRPVESAKLNVYVPVVHVNVYVFVPLGYTKLCLGAQRPWSKTRPQIWSKI